MSGSSLAKIGVRVSDWFEHWFPDAFVFAVLAVAAVFAASLAAGHSAAETALWFGSGFWELVRFTMQMTLIVVSGYAVATAPPVYRSIEWLSGRARHPREAVVLVALFSMLTSLLSWSFSLIFSGLLAREVAHRVKGCDYRAVGAAAYLGLSSVSMMGLSSSAALIMANPGSMPAGLLKVSGVIPLEETIFLWQGGVIVFSLIAASLIVAYWVTPAAEDARGMEELGVSYAPLIGKPERPKRPGEWLEYQPWLSLMLVSIGGLYLWQVLGRGGARELLELNNYIFAFLMMALLLHWRPRSFMTAIAQSVPAAAGILIQYPLYGGILKIMTESDLAERLAHFFVSVSTRESYPVWVGLYSGLLGFFIPSAGGKWLIEAPYLMQAANELQVHRGWVVQVYNAAEALPCMIHPFWMLPLLGILRLRARDIVGYSAIQLLVHAPLVLFLCWALNATLPYRPLP